MYSNDPSNPKFKLTLKGEIITEVTVNPAKLNFGNLGKKQMSTDTAVLVSFEILEGAKFSDLKFKDEIVLPIKSGEEVILPFRYLLEDGKPVITPGLDKMLKEQEGF